MSSKEMLQSSLVDEVNLNGTCNVLDVCHEFCIKRLVYVSTYNVVFGGKEIINGNESLPYYSIDEHVDPYGRSKSIAEQLVLKSNGRPSKKRSVNLYTCAIRPAAIYGPGEERHFPRIISIAKMGLVFFRVGDSSVKTDWVYVDNLVLALILASMGLLDDIPGRKGSPIAAGQAYFISDGSPVNTYDFIIVPLLKSLAYDVPKISINVSHTLLLSRFFWLISMLIYPWLKHQWVPGPLILPAEVFKMLHFKNIASMDYVILFCKLKELWYRESALWLPILVAAACFLLCDLRPSIISCLALILSTSSLYTVCVGSVCMRMYRAAGWLIGGSGWNTVGLLVSERFFLIGLLARKEIKKELKDKVGTSLDKLIKLDFEKTLGNNQQKNVLSQGFESLRHANEVEEGYERP
ncbi:hypothetical protein HPP92_020105 [Vanilla planifolia]|uniref:3-beta hydroxysteroid dehydrogenase/isomerase domain-containing protein n=1 Tax=Vanilla planifolia TaxID=51239 RepID=A0A835UNJ4_VANPL|nr:hypothetical protein HPP92_020105 [Vanilla planifolia]